MTFHGVGVDFSGTAINVVNLTKPGNNSNLPKLTNLIILAFAHLK